jgi:hypothetical protein
MRALSAGLLGLFMLCSAQPPSGARHGLIRPDGSGDAPTIQAGIDSASVEDTVLVGNSGGDWTGPLEALRAAEFTAPRVWPDWCLAYWLRWDLHLPGLLGGLKAIFVR